MKRKNTLEFNLRLTTNEVINRILESSDDQHVALSLSGYAGNKPFLLRRDGNRFRIQMRRYYGNNTPSYLFAEVVPTSYGSKLSGYFSMSKGAKVSIVLYFVLVGTFLLHELLMMAKGYLSGKSYLNEFPGILIPIGMLIAAALMMALVNFLSRKDVRDISKWLHELFADAEIEMDHKF